MQDSKHCEAKNKPWQAKLAGLDNLRGHRNKTRTRPKQSRSHLGGRLGRGQGSPHHRWSRHGWRVPLECRHWRQFRSVVLKAMTQGPLASTAIALLQLTIHFRNELVSDERSLGSQYGGNGSSQQDQLHHLERCLVCNKCGGDVPNWRR